MFREDRHIFFFSQCLQGRGEDNTFRQARNLVSPLAANHRASDLENNSGALDGVRYGPGDGGAGRFIVVIRKMRGFTCTALDGQSTAEADELFDRLRGRGNTRFPWATLLQYCNLHEFPCAFAQLNPYALSPPLCEEGQI